MIYPPRPLPRQNIRQAGTETAEREQLGDYYLYPISGRTTIADRQTKQVSFLDVQAVPAQRTYEYRVGWLQTMEEPQSFNTVLKFSSSSKGGLGRSEEHTSELQSLMRISYAVFCLKKKNT